MLRHLGPLTWLGTIAYHQPGAHQPRAEADGWWVIMVMVIEMEMEMMAIGVVAVATVGARAFYN